MTIFTIAEGTRTIKIGYSIAEMEEKLEKLIEEDKKLEYKLGKLKTLKKISLRVKEMKLGLFIPDDKKDTILVKEPYEHVNKNSYGKIEA